MKYSCRSLILNSVQNRAASAGTILRYLYVETSRAIRGQMEQESAAERVVQMVPWKEARIVAGWNRIRTLRGIADQNKSTSRVLGGTSLSAKPGGRLPQGEGDSGFEESLSSLSN